MNHVAKEDIETLESLIEQLEDLKRIKISQDLIDLEKEILQMINPTKLEDKKKVEQLFSMGYSVVNNINDIQYIISVDDLFENVFAQHTIDAKNFELANPLALYLKGIIYGMFNLSDMAKGFAKLYKNKFDQFQTSIDLYRNLKGKRWRDDLYKLAKLVYEENIILKKTQALDIAFEKLPNKEEHRKDFDLHHKSIYEKFRVQT